MKQVVVGVLVRDGQVLLVHRGPERHAYPNVWDLPGGHVEPGESELIALGRELREELGIEVALGSAELWCEAPAGGPDDPVSLGLWLVREWAGTVTNLAPDEHDELRWFDLDELPHQPAESVGPALAALAQHLIRSSAEGLRGLAQSFADEGGQRLS